MRSPRAPFAALVALSLALTLHPHASGQTPALEVFYRKLEPKEALKYKAMVKDKDGKKVQQSSVAVAGVHRWEVPETEFGTNGLDRNFTGYCAEATVPMESNKTYRFQINSTSSSDNFAVSDSPEPERAAQRRVKYIQELFGRYYQDAQARAVNPDEAVAFQVALWELIQESEPADGEARFDVFGGDFQVDYPNDAAPASVTKAQEYLNSLTGNDALYYENPELRGRELIRLKGIPNAEGVTAQSQFALRFAGGGGIGSTNPRPLTSGGLPVAGGGGDPGNGLGGGGAGGGLITGGNSPTFPTLVPNTNTPGNGTTTTTTPPTRTTTRPPIDQPPNDPTPVPVPAGLLLGAIALGSLGSWRLGARLLAAK
jgi:hypothetical protein